MGRGRHLCVGFCELRLKDGLCPQLARKVSRDLQNVALETASAVECWARVLQVLSLVSFLTANGTCNALDAVLEHQKGRRFPGKCRFVPSIDTVPGTQ